MPDINRKFVMFYAARGYRTGQTVTINIYDTVGTKEVNAQAMTELGTTGVYTFNWFPRKRTFYTAIMDCVEFPRQSHEIIEVKKIKTAGAITFPKTAQTFKIDEKNKLMELVNNINFNLNNTSKNQVELMNKILEKGNNNIGKELMKELESLKTEVSISKRDTSELVKTSLKRMVNDNFESMSAMKTEIFSKISSKIEHLSEANEMIKGFNQKLKALGNSNVTNQLTKLNEKFISLNSGIDEINANLSAFGEAYSTTIKDKIGTIEKNLDELSILMKDGKAE